MDVQQCKRWAENHTDLFIDLVRVYLGAGLFVKGIYFMAQRDYLQKLLEDSGNLVIAPVTIVHYVIPVHILGGLLLALEIAVTVIKLSLCGHLWHSCG